MCPAAGSGPLSTEPGQAQGGAGLGCSLGRCGPWEMATSQRGLGRKAEDPIHSPSVHLLSSMRGGCEHRTKLFGGGLSLEGVRLPKQATRATCKCPHLRPSHGPSGSPNQQGFSRTRWGSQTFNREAGTRSLYRSGGRGPGPPTHLDESKHLVLHTGGGAVLGRDDLDQDAVDEVPVGHEHVEAVAAVLHTCLQHLMRAGREVTTGTEGQQIATSCLDCPANRLLQRQTPGTGAPCWPGSLGYTAVRRHQLLHKKDAGVSVGSMTERPQKQASEWTAIAGRHGPSWEKAARMACSLL